MVSPCCAFSNKAENASVIPVAPLFCAWGSIPWTTWRSYTSVRATSHSAREHLVEESHRPVDGLFRLRQIAEIDRVPAMIRLIRLHLLAGSPQRLHISLDHRWRRVIVVARILDQQRTAHLGRFGDSRRIAVF